MGKQNNILKLISVSGGSLRLSQLKSAFADYFGGRQLGEPSHLTLNKWLATFPRVDVYRQSGSDWVIREKSVGTSSTQRTGSFSELSSLESPSLPETRVSSPTSPPTVRSDHEDEENGKDIAANILDLLGGSYSATEIHQDSQSLLDLLPLEWSNSLNAIGMERVVDISLDVGRRPCCWHNHGRTFLSDDPTVKVQGFDIDAITASLQGFGDDNRAGIDGQLHRISAIRNNSEKIIGLTIRIGRHIEGNADMLCDIINGNKSVLLLGEVSQICSMPTSNSSINTHSIRLAWKRQDDNRERYRQKAFPVVKCFRRRYVERDLRGRKRPPRMCWTCKANDGEVALKAI